MRAVVVPRSLASAIVCSLIGSLGAGVALDLRAQTNEALPAVTNVLQLSDVAAQNPSVGYAIQLAGTVWWVDPATGRFVLRDSSGAEQLDVNASALSSIRPGERVRIEGNATITRSGAGFTIGARGPVVNNNGVHAAIEKSGTVFLRAGFQPLAVEWFNGVEKYTLEVGYEGPDLPRQSIPDSALFRAAGVSPDGRTNFVNGLDYHCFEGPWDALPDLEALPPVKSGISTNFDLRLISRPEHVALRFSGWLKVPRDGFYTFYSRSDDGSRVFAGTDTCAITAVGNGRLAGFPAPGRIAVGQPLGEGGDCRWAEVEGTVKFASEQGGAVVLELTSGTGRMRVEVVNGSGLSPAALLNHQVRVVGVCQSTATADGQKVAGALLASDQQNVQVIEPPHEMGEGTAPGAVPLPLLTTAVEVHHLRREDAERGYPVRLRGIITCVFPEHQAFTIEDDTRGLYVEDLSDSRSSPAQVGEYVEVEGTTDPSRFAPIVSARRVRSLGAGRLPEPVHPTWDQLMNGSLDAQYVELRGVITAVQPPMMTLFTEGGVIKIEVRANGVDAAQLGHYEDALVRLRGCLLATWDYLTHQVKMGAIKIYTADITVDQPAPVDLFSTPAKTAAELLYFDPQAGVFQRVKVAGQVVAVRDGEYFMMQGGKGVRFLGKQPLDVAAGDTVEVVGFPDLLSSAAPVLREAVARKVGVAPLPEARKLAADDLVRADNDSTRVRLEGLLVSARRVGSEQILEMQNGVRTFMARLEQGSEAIQSLPAGTRVELTGVYAGRGWNRLGGAGLASFELLVRSAADVQVLARPPWWTLQRLLVIVGALACVLAATVLWITQLHRQVDERTTELGRQIQERQRAEHQHAMELERARIAQDLHDELGSGITEISMLAARARSASPPDDQRSRYLDQAGDKAREMVTALDEIVWAMNPRHNTIGSLVSYFSLYADRFLGLANIAWRLDTPPPAPDYVVDSRRRHQLFLAFKEALTNVVRHSQAQEVRLGFQVERDEVRLSVADNGRGLSPAARTDAMDGVANMRTRLEKLGGRCDVAGTEGQGTVVRFYVPLS